MKSESIVTITGSVICILGVVFHLQGQSVVGPESSFMYSNPQWVNYGMQIATGGMIIAIAGIIIKRMNGKSFRF